MSHCSECGMECSSPNPGFHQTGPGSYIDCPTCVARLKARSLRPVPPCAICHGAGRFHPEPGCTAIAICPRCSDAAVFEDWSQPPANGPCRSCAGRGVLERFVAGDACLDIIECPACGGDPPACQVQ